MFWYEEYPLAEQYPAAAGPHRLLDVDMSQRGWEKKPSLIPFLWFSQCFHSVGCSSASVLNKETITEGPEIPCLFSDKFSSLISTFPCRPCLTELLLCWFPLDFRRSHPIPCTTPCVQYLVWAIATAIKPVEMPLSCVVTPRGTSAGTFGADSLRTISLPWHSWRSQAHGVGCLIARSWSGLILVLLSEGYEPVRGCPSCFETKEVIVYPQKLPRKIRIFSHVTHWPGGSTTLDNLHLCDGKLEMFSFSIRKADTKKSFLVHHPDTCSPTFGGSNSFSFTVNHVICHSWVKFISWAAAKLISPKPGSPWEGEQ